jgi:hypothetical protein
MRVKKSNIQIVKDYLSGERPFVTVGYVPPPVKRNGGEQWTDASGVVWEQRNGYKVRVNEQAQMIREARRDKCECGQDIQYGSKLDNLFFRKTGKCYECLIKQEQEYHILGVFNHYENWKLISNYLGYLEDVREKIGDSIKYLSNEDGSLKVLCNGEGYIEKFSGINTSELLESAKKDFEEVKKNIEKVTKDKVKAKAIFDKEYKKAMKRLPPVKS